MSRGEPPRGWRAVALYAWFDTVTLFTGWTIVKLLAMPALVVIPLGLMVMFSGRVVEDAAEMAVDRTLVVVADAELRGMLEEDNVAAWGWTLAEAWPDDFEVQLERGQWSMAAEVPDDLAAGEILIRAGPGVVAFETDRLRQTLGWWLLDRRAEALGGPQPDLVVESDGARPETVPARWRNKRKAVQSEQPASGPTDKRRDEPDDEPAAPSMFESTTAANVLGFFVIGLMGISTGLGIGPALEKSAKSGFNHVLALGTSARDIYTSELVVASVMQGTVAMAWWLLYAVGAVAVGSSLGVTLPSGGAIFADAPVFVGLAVLAIVQGSTLSFLAVRSAADLPREVRERGASGLGTVLFVVFITMPEWLINDTTIAAAGLLPVLGPLALWSHHVSAGPWALPLAVVQIVWSILAIQLGSWTYLLDETPWSAVKRRWLA